jgi:hypothetical protein
MGALNGWSGRTTARMVDRLIRREKEVAPERSVYVPSLAPPASSNGSQQPLDRVLR